MFSPNENQSQFRVIGNFYQKFWPIIVISDRINFSVKSVQLVSDQYIFYLIFPVRKKSQNVKSRKCACQTAGLPLPVQLLEMFVQKYALNSLDYPERARPF